MLAMTIMFPAQLSCKQCACTKGLSAAHLQQPLPSSLCSVCDLFSHKYCVCKPFGIVSIGHPAALACKNTAADNGVRSDSDLKFKIECAHQIAVTHTRSAPVFGDQQTEQLPSPSAVILICATALEKEVKPMYTSDIWKVTGKFSVKTENKPVYTSDIWKRTEGRDPQQSLSAQCQGF